MYVVTFVILVLIGIPVWLYIFVKTANWDNFPRFSLYLLVFLCFLLFNGLILGTVSDMEKDTLISDVDWWKE